MIPGHRSSLNILCALIVIAAAGCLADGTADQDDMAARLSASVEEFSVTTDGTLPDKPATRLAAAAPPWTVSLVTSLPSLWAGYYTVLTATTNMDVGPTPYYIRIWDDDSGSYIASCGAGTTCSISVTWPGPRTTSFKALVATESGISVASAFASVYWHVSGLRLTESETTVAAGSIVLLTTFTDYDIGTSPYYVQIYDDTTSTVLGSCGAGTTCSVTVSQAAAATHRYRACFSGSSTSYTPQNILECTPQKLVTWSSNPVTRVFLQPSSPDTITATSSIDVTTTPFYIQIYNLNGDRIAACNSGTRCSIVGNLGCDMHLIASVGSMSSTPTIPPIELGALATSHVFSVAQWIRQGAPVGPCPPPPPHNPPLPLIH